MGPRKHDCKLAFSLVPCAGRLGSCLGIRERSPTEIGPASSQTNSAKLGRLQLLAPFASQSQLGIIP